MIKLLEFECKACGNLFEECVEVKVGSANDIGEFPVCPSCSSKETVRVTVSKPSHTKHSSWRP
jgi:NAD-dependent SIR2 family protein deacetylase